MTNFDQLIDRQGTFAVKHEALPEGAPRDSLALWVADMDFPVAPPIQRAMEKRLSHGIFGYTIYRSAELMEAVTGWYSRRYGWEINPENLFYSPGVVPALSILIQLLSQEGDGIIIQKPVYYPFSLKIKANNRTLVDSTLLEKGGSYKMNFEDLEEKFKDPKNKGMILCNPHNPVGRVWSKEELTRLVDLARKYGKWIISDEIHGDLTKKGIKYTPLMSLAQDIADQIVVCTAPSKVFNLAGLQLSNIVIHNKDWQQSWTDLVEKNLSLGSPNPLAVVATIAAYNESEEWLEDLKGYLDENFAYVEDFIEKHLPKARFMAREGTYLAWIDLRQYTKDPHQLEKAMQAQKLALDEGYIFGRPGAGFERLNLATPRANLEEAMKRIQRALEGF